MCRIMSCYLKYNIELRRIYIREMSIILLRFMRRNIGTDYVDSYELILIET